MGLSIGIDLGTTNSVASFMRGGKPEAILNRNGEYLTPSVVGFRNGKYLVGSDAINFSEQNPVDSIYSIKRLMGLNFSDEKVQELALHLPYTIQPPANGEDIGVRVLIDGREHTPIEVSTLVLKSIKSDCEKRLNGVVTDATITTPAYFLDTQKHATKLAGEAAGLRLRPLLNEPVAAALAFCFEEQKENQRLLVYDLGGGTFDVSVVQLHGDNMQVLYNLGDMWLGGDDFDKIIMQRVFSWLSDKHGIAEIKDPLVNGRIRQVAQRAKHELSNRDEYQILEPFLFTDPERGKVSLDLTVTRAEFEAGMLPYIDQSLVLVENVLKGAGVRDRHLTHVVLAGGSTKIPCVRAALKTRFGAEKVRHDIEPMHCVSLGAALWNERCPTEGKISKPSGLTTSRNLGVEIYYNDNAHHFWTIVPANTPYPTPSGRFSEVFLPVSDNQRGIRVPVFQGESPLTTFNSCQGVINYELPRGIPAKTPVKIVFDIDVHGNLSVQIEIEGFPSQKWNIDRNQPVTTADDLQRVDNLEDLQNRIANAQHFLTDFREFIKDKESQAIEEAMTKAKQGVALRDRRQCTQAKRLLSLALINSGYASDLFLSRRAQDLAEPLESRELAKLRTALQEALRQKDEEKARRIADGLKLRYNRILNKKTTINGPGGGGLTK